MKAPIPVGSKVFHQGAIMEVVNSYYKLDRWYYGLLHRPYLHTYTTAERYVVLAELPVLTVEKVGELVY